LAACFMSGLNGCACAKSSAKDLSQGQCNLLSAEGICVDSIGKRNQANLFLFM